MIITAKSIGVTFYKKKHTVKAFEKVSISFEKGELTLITGRSGSGKTTLINALAGFIPANEGQILYDGQDISLLDDKALSGLRCKSIGFIPQGQSALANLTVLQNILLPSALAGQSNIAYAEQLLVAVGLERLTNAYPDELSGGELRRLAAARALINSPSVIIADEPTNDLDEENSAIVLKILKEQAQSGAAVIIVTHDSAAFKYADRIFHMDGGRLIGKDNEYETTLCRPLVS